MKYYTQSVVTSSISDELPSDSKTIQIPHEGCIYILSRGNYYTFATLVLSGAVKSVLGLFDKYLTPDMLKPGYCS